MLKLLVGDVDLYSAAVLIAFALGLAIFCTTWIAHRRSRRALEMDHELAKIRQADATLIAQQGIVANHDTERKKIEQGLITSHARRNESGGDG